MQSNNNLIKNGVNPSLLFHKSHEDLLSVKNTTFYLGIDPTSSSLHIGHLIPLKLAMELIDAGWKCIILIGGFTGAIGDPTDKKALRSPIDSQTIKRNISSLKKQLKKIFQHRKVLMVNNATWMNRMALKSYLEIGLQISVNQKVSLDTFANRLNNSLPLSMTEFIYSDLQALDFLHLYNKYKCRVQIGGQDQWGNISQGLHMVQKITKEKQIYGITTPLLTNNGVKMGKTEKPMNLFQDPFDIYDYLYRQGPEFRQQLSKYFSCTTDNLFDTLMQIIGVNQNIIHRIKQHNWRNAYRTSETKLSNILFYFKYVGSTTEAKEKIKDGALLIDGVKVQENQSLLRGKTYKVQYSNFMPRYVKIVS